MVKLAARSLEEAYVTGLENGQELRVDFEPLDALARALGISMLALVADRPRTKTAVERDEERKRDQRRVLGWLSPATSHLLRG